MGKIDHEEHAAAVLQRLQCAVVIVSESRTLATDVSGALIKGLLTEAGHDVKCFELISNHSKTIENTLLNLLSMDLNCIFFTGGTGLGKKDITIETVTPFLEKKLDGFGELFRHLSFKSIGATAMMSRALAGCAKEKLIVCLPGSKDAVELAMKQLLIPELKHLIWVITK